MTKYMGLIVIAASLLWGCSTESDSAAKLEQSSKEWVDLLSPEQSPRWVSVGSTALNPAWKIQDGVLALTKAGGGDVTTGVTYGNFELSLEWNISKGGNSGIFFMANPNTQQVPVWTSALEMQILDDVHHSDNKTAFTRAGSSYGLYETRDGVAKPYGEWNAVRIFVKDGKVEHWLNGVKVVAFDTRSEDFKARVANSKFNDYADVFAQSSRGLVVLQDHQDPVQFRNIKIRDLD